MIKFGSLNTIIIEDEDVIIEPSGSFHGSDAYLLTTCSGGYVDPYRYPIMEHHETEDLWKCIACGRVYKLKEHLDCQSCGTSVTEKSRFVLE